MIAVLLAALLVALSFGSGCGGAEPVPGIEEPSGITRSGDRLLIVGDDRPGVWYSFPVDDDAAGRIPLPPEELEVHDSAVGIYAMDLEAIDVLADGRVVILSEYLRSLVDAEGIVAVYPDHLAELGGRGIEGIAVRDLGGGRSRVAVLWEGGYPGASSMPRGLRHAAGTAMRPVILVHDLEPGQTGLLIDGDEVVADIELRLPEPPGEEPFAQRFRAPDVVWHEVDGEPVFVVLISSGWGEKPEAGSEAECPKRDANGRPLRYCWRWLQRFALDGEPIGEPYDLEPVFPAELAHENWEGMDWFVRGESLVFVYDEKLDKQPVTPQEAFVMPLPKGW